MAASLSAHFNDIKAVAVSETWINNEKGADFVLNGYNSDYVSRVMLLM